MIVGTSYFVSRAAANAYYADYGCTAENVAHKIRDGEIHIGKPSLKVGERLVLLDDGRRYGRVEAESCKA